MKTKLLVISFGIVTILLAAFFITFSCSELEDATSAAGGSGGGLTPCTDTNATGITTAEELQAVKDTLAGNFCLNQDIDLSTIADFEPIGTPSTPFTGTLDGNSKKITNLTINRPTESQIGLFGVTSLAATIKDLTIETASVVGNAQTGILVGINEASITNVDIIGTNTLEGQGSKTGAIAAENVGASITDCNSAASITGTSGVGGLVGYSNGSTISNCHTTGTITATSGYSGGLIAEVRSNTTNSISNSSSTINVNGTIIGGLVGYASYTLSITNSHATGTMTASGRAGGLIGISSGENTITDSYATGAVTTTDDKAGGLIGTVSSSASAATVTNCYATGNVSGDGYLGGLVGDAGNATITNCYASGTVDGSGGRVGGLIGLLDNANLSKSYSTGNITGTSYMGGLIGASGGSNTIEDSYSTGNVTGSTTTYLGGFVGDPSSSIVDTIRRCYSTGAVSSGKGGFAGKNSSVIVLADNYFDTASAGTTAEAGLADVSGITGIVAGDIGSGGTTPFQNNNWDFTTVWNAEGTGTWPTLK